MSGDAFDLAILGGGPGGLVVASIAGQLGLRTMLVEAGGQLGGDCLHYGCVPSKTLINSARLAHRMRTAGRFGLQSADPAVDFAAVRTRLQSVVAHIGRHDDPERFREYGVDVRFGTPRFIDPWHIRLNAETVAARRIVIATGSDPLIPDIPGLEEAGHDTNKTLFAIDTLPDHLVVLGGGAVGLEMAQAFARLGSRVTVLEAAPGLLPAESEDAVAALAARLESENVTLHTGTTAQRVSADAQGVTTVHCSNAAVLTCDRLLIATGRRPAVAGLGLANAGVECTDAGITVDARMRTRQRHIYAIGDVTGIMPFTHVAEYQAGIVIANALFRVPRRADYSAVPWVIHTDPEFARVGLNETQARAHGIVCNNVRFGFNHIDRAVTDGVDTGQLELTLDKRGRIRGATILGPSAGELIHELALAVRRKLKPADLSGLVHAYPTLAEINRRAANAHLGRKLFRPVTRTAVKWLSRVPP